MTKFRLGKSLDTQLREQGFNFRACIGHDNQKSRLPESIVELMEMGLMVQSIHQDLEELEFYIASFKVVGLKEEDYLTLDKKPLNGKGYALYCRRKSDR